MPVLEGWTFAAARGAARKTLFEVAEASGIGPGVLDDIERARDIPVGGGRFETTHLERVVDVYAKLGFRIMPRTLFRPAYVMRVQ